MADVKISALDSLTGTLGGADYIPVVEDPAGTPKTVKVPVSTIIPASGAVDEVLVKSSATDYDTEWKAPFQHRVAIVEWRGTAGANGPSLAVGINDALFYTIVHNGIPSGFSLPSAGTMKFPVGTFLIDMKLGPYSVGYSRLMVQRVGDSAYVLAGPTAYSLVGAISPLSLKGVLTVTSVAETYDIQVTVSRAERAGLQDIQTYIAYETYGQIVIQQLTD